MPRFPDGARARLGRRVSRDPPMDSQGPGAGKARMATVLPPRLPTVGVPGRGLPWARTWRGFRRGASRPAGRGESAGRDHFGALINYCLCSQVPYI